MLEYIIHINQGRNISALIVIWTESASRLRKSAHLLCFMFWLQQARICRLCVNIHYTGTYVGLFPLSLYLYTEQKNAFNWIVRQSIFIFIVFAIQIQYIDATAFRKWCVEGDTK